MLLQRGTFLLTAGLILGGAACAQAADLGGSYKDAGYAPMAAPSPTWYFRIDGGYALNSDPGVSDGGIGGTVNYAIYNDGIDNTWTIGGGIGRYFGNNWRGDITVDYRFNSEVSGTVDNGIPPTGRLSADLSSTVVLANLYYDFNRGSRFTPYVGAGIGFVHHRMDSGSVVAGCCVLPVDGDNDTDFAAALMAGFTWSSKRQEVTGSTKDGPIYVETDRGWKVDFGYRFLYLGDAATGRVIDPTGPTVTSGGFKVDDITAHEFRIGLRYDIR